jgi:Heparinase II/III N-terminus
MRLFANVLDLAHDLGPRWIVYRAWLAVQRRTGWLERSMPACSWGEQPLERLLVNRDLADPGRYLEYRRGTAPRFLFAPSDRCRYGEILRGMDRLDPSVLKDADRVVGGGVQFFGDRWVDTGTEIDWHWDYLGDRRWPSEGHWSRINEFWEGDIKHVWEPSRFGFVFTLVRAYWRNPDTRYPEFFWRRMESWRAANPPNTGVHWICGQETALRALACCFGLYGFLDSASTTPERVRMLAEFLAVSANRISGHLGYALSQNNNHGVSEAMGLYLVGLLFPEFKDSAQWRVQGRAALDRQARSLILATFVELPSGDAPRLSAGSKACGDPFGSFPG